MKLAVFYENIITGIEHDGISLEQGLKALKECGLELLYISGDSYEKDKDMLLPLMEKFDLGFEGMHQHFDFGHDPENRSYEKYIDMAAEAGMENILLVPGFIPPEEKDKEDQIKTNMLACMKRAVEYGKMKNVFVCMEDFDHAISPINSVAGLDYFFNEIADLKCAFDTGNFCYYKEDEVEAFDHFRDKIVTMHIKDRKRDKTENSSFGCECQDGNIVWSVPIGSGYVRIKEIVQKLKNSGYEGTLISELYGYDDSINGFKESLQYLKKCLGEV